MSINMDFIPFSSSSIVLLPAADRKGLVVKINETPHSKNVASVATNNPLALRYAINNSARTGKFTDNSGDRTHYYTKDGERFSWKTWVPKDVKAVMIGIPGMGSAASELASLTDILLPKNIALYALNLRGQGLDPVVKRRGNELNVEQLLSDISDAIAAVRQKYPDTPILLYGESMGALLAIKLLTTKKRASLPPIKGVILSAPVVELARPTSPFLRTIISLAARWFPSFKISAKLFTKNAAPLSHDPEKQRFLENAPYRIEKFSVSFLHNMGLLMSSANEAAERIEEPILVLGAKKDDFIDPKQLRHWFNRIGSSNKTLKFYSKSYHRLLFDLEAPKVKESINESLSLWLKKHKAEKLTERTF